MYLIFFCGFSNLSLYQGCRLLEEGNVWIALYKTYNKISQLWILFKVFGNFGPFPKDKTYATMMSKLAQFETYLLRIPFIVF
jgi:hypothetical protein